jgi:hypothetical protein
MKLGVKTTGKESSSRMNVRRTSFDSMALKTTACTIVMLLHVCSTVVSVDGFLVPHRKDEVPDDLLAQQLMEGRMSGRLHDVKKGKKGKS